MNVEAIAIVSAVVLAYSLVSRRLEATWVTGPMLFVAAGILLGPQAVGVMSGEMGEGGVRLLAEATLVLLLFTDAVRIDLSILRRHIELPARLLGLGLPLTIVTGTAFAAVVFTDFGFWEAALLAAILTPTDAAVGKSVVSNPRVPARVRQALTVESGLNDGLMLPVIFVFLALAAATGEVAAPDSWVEFVARQIGWGVLMGASAGYAGGWLIDRYSTMGWIDGAFRQLATLSVGVGAFALAQSAGGNGFVAAFVAGLAFGSAARDHCHGAYDFAEDEGELLSLLTFLIFGAVIAGPALGELTWRVALYAGFSLFVARPLPAAFSLLGSGLKMPTVAYIGWFGPRGLASILFGLFILEQAELPHGDEILLVVTWTVLSSVLLHGASSAGVTKRYAAWFKDHGRPDMQEAVPVEEMPA